MDYLLSNFKTDPKRAASDSIRGYVYQAYQSIFTWINLQDNEMLVLEGAEDFDIHSDSDLSVTTTQVKDVQSNLTLRSNAIIDSLNNFWLHTQDNPDYNIKLNFLSTASAGKEKEYDFPEGERGLIYWKYTESEHVDLNPLKELLLTLKLNDSLAHFIEHATDIELREQLIRKITWSLGSKPKEALQNAIEGKLKLHGHKISVDVATSINTLPNLFKHIADMLSSKGLKKLTYSDFLDCFYKATHTSIPHSALTSLLLTTHNLQAEIAKLTSIPSAVSAIHPIVDGSIQREHLVDDLLKQLQEMKLVFLSGSSGAGKTNLAILACQKIKNNWQLANLRGVSKEQIKDILNRVAVNINENMLSPFFILDDINFNEISFFEREFTSLIFTIFEKKGMVIITGQNRPPQDLFSQLWVNETCHISVPYFQKAEIEEMLFSHHYPQEKDLSNQAEAIFLATEGHPQLVHATIRGLREQDWQERSVVELVSSDNYKKIRSDIRMKLFNTLSSDQARILIYRLSLFKGNMSREDAIAMADIPPPTPLAGEVFDKLVGPWVEEVGNGLYRISPLLANAANDVFTKTEINTIHSSIFEHLMQNDSLNPIQIGNAFYHAYTAKHSDGLKGLLAAFFEQNYEYYYYLYEVLEWMTLLHLKQYEKIFPNNLRIDFQLRLMQFILLESASKQELSNIIIHKVEEALNNIKQQHEQHGEIEQLEVIAYSIILRGRNIAIPVKHLIPMLVKLIEISKHHSDYAALLESHKTINENSLYPVHQRNTIQAMFSIQLTNCTDFENLIQILDLLNDVLPEYKNVLFDTLNDDMELTSVLINQICSISLKTNSDNQSIQQIITSLDIIINNSKELNLITLVRASLIAKAIVYDEYMHSNESSLTVLEQALQIYPDDAYILSQQIKTLFNAQKFLEVIVLTKKVMQSTELSKVSIVVSCRLAAIASVKLDDWVEAEHFFLYAMQKSAKFSRLHNVVVGLIADTAFVQWKLKKYEASLNNFLNTLERLEKINISDDISVKYIHAIVRHMIAWISFDARKERIPDDFFEPIVGMCSNPDPNDQIKDHIIIDLSGAWVLLGLTEAALGLELGIQKRVSQVPSEGKILSTSIHESIVLYELVFNKKQFNDFITKFIKLQEACEYFKQLNDEADRLSVGNIPPLPISFWQQENNQFKLYSALLKVCLAIRQNDQSMPFPTEEWRSELFKRDMLSKQLNGFLKVLEGHTSDNSLHQNAAQIVSRVQGNTLTPVELWMASLYLVNVFVNDDHFVNESLHEFITSRWIYAIENQRFAFLTPSLICPTINKICLNEASSEVTRIARIMYETVPYLEIPIAKTTLEELKKISERYVHI